jgi:lipopolysaccharide export system protein LptA
MLFAFTVRAQRMVTADTATAGTTLVILKADRYNYIKKDSLNVFASLGGHVEMRQDKTLFYADSAVVNLVDNTMEAFGNVHINDADSVHTYAQYMRYKGKERKAFLQKKVKLTDGKSTLTTDELEYDASVKIGTYLKNGKLVNKKTVLTSTEGYYYGDTKDVIFKRKVELIDPEYKVYTDTLQYNTNTEISTFTSPTTIYNEKRIIKTRNGYFDKKNKKSILYERSFIDDSTYTATADEMAFDDSTGMSELRGNAVLRGKDSTEGADIIANNIRINKKNNSALATEKPLLLIKQERDTIFVAATLLYTARLSDLIKTRPVPQVRDSTAPAMGINKPDSSSDKFFEAYNNVKIFSDSLQAVGDSLFYSLKDSVFRLFKEPIVWAKENQITGDTIYLYLKNKKPERLFVFNNGMALSRVDSTQYFQQIKGYTINALFDNGKINYLQAKGYAENVYYAQDDSKRLVGVNKSSCDMIRAYFADGKLKRVNLLNKVEGTMYPMLQVNHDDLKLRNFHWYDSKRPKSKFDILAN